MSASGKLHTTFKSSGLRLVPGIFITEKYREDLFFKYSFWILSSYILLKNILIFSIYTENKTPTITPNIVAVRPI